jgi:hypothetical protein
MMHSYSGTPMHLLSGVDRGAMVLDSCQEVPFRPPLTGCCGARGSLRRPQRRPPLLVIVSQPAQGRSHRSNRPVSANLQLRLHRCAQRVRLAVSSLDCGRGSCFIIAQNPARRGLPHLPAKESAIDAGVLLSINSRPGSRPGILLFPQNTCWSIVSAG